MAGEPVLLVCDLHLQEAAQRKGLGKHLMTLCDLVSRKQARAPGRGGSVRWAAPRRNARRSHTLVLPAPPPTRRGCRAPSSPCRATTRRSPSSRASAATRRTPSGAAAAAATACRSGSEGHPAH